MTPAVPAARTTDPAPAASAPVPARAPRWRRWLGGLLAWTRRSAARRALASLGDHDRRDIGLPPRDTRPAATDLLWRR